MQPNIIPRGTGNSNIRLLVSGQDTVLSPQDPFFKQFPSIDIIRIPSEEYVFLDHVGEIFVHFNLQISYHKVGSIYLLPKIIEPGYFNGEQEVLPLLDFQNIYYAECVAVKECLHYSDVTPDDLKSSFPPMKNVQELQQIIIKRYSKSMPHLSVEELINAGISKTTLKILGRI